jgi:hypothetical protein
MKKRDQMKHQPRAAVPGPLRVPGSPPRGPARQREQAPRAGTAADCRPVAA